MRVNIRHLGVQDYRQTWQQMQQFNQNRNKTTADEIWLLQHPSVFTLGLNGKREHLLDIGTIPLVETDRGGQVTYHGPGQLIAYLLFDIKRRKLGVREMVTRLEQSVVDFLADQGIVAESKRQAPGVYVDEEKIAALGLRVKQGGSYHGLSLNVDLDLQPFERINPCGYEGLKATSMAKLGQQLTTAQVEVLYLPYLCQQFGIDEINHIHE